MKLTDTHKLSLGFTLLPLSAALISAGCGVAWGLAGGLIGLGVITCIFGIASFASLSD